MMRSNPERRAPSATASTPPTRRRRPSRASSPQDACSARRSRGTWREAASSERAIGRSKPEPSFFSSAGARLTVMRLPGHCNSAERIPLRTRCLASWQARSARPTMVSDGVLLPWICASTSTRRGSRPTRAKVTARASTTRSYAGSCHATVSIQRAINTSSKNSPARRPVRRLTCRRSRSWSRRPARSRMSG